MGHRCEGEVVLYDNYVSFLGEVDPEKGFLRTGMGEIEIAGKALVMRGSRGSTVGSYILYALARRGKSPKCIVVKEAEPILVAGCVLGDIPLIIAEEYDKLVNDLSSGGLKRILCEDGFIHAF